jgi:hypothetical protein
VDIVDIDNKNIYIAICCFTSIKSTFYTKNNLDKNYPYKILEQDIYNMKNEGIILMLGDFNDRNKINQAIILCNDSNPNTLWLDEDLVLANNYKRNSEVLIKNLFGTKLIQLYSSQYLIICNGLRNCPNYNSMDCIHRLGSSVINYVILDIPIYNQIVNFDILHDHELDFDHRHLTLALSFVMHKIFVEEHSNNHRHLLFDK